MTFLLTCKDFLHELSDYLDGTCDPDLRSKLEKHINECPNCWVICDTSSKTIQVYRGMDPQPIPQEIHDRLMSAIQKKMSGKCGGSTA
ncbi:MAG: zf-HC2 domain-containing protein [Bryobacteraceae bacterium]